MKFRLIILISIFFVSCIQVKRKANEEKLRNDTTALISDTSASQINTANTSPAELVKYAETLIGIPYLYGSTDPQKGFDCSGFITYVFNYFNISVPRSSIEFTNVGS